MVEDEERQVFLNTYLGGPALAAYERGETKQVKNFFVMLPNEEIGRYVKVEMSMVSTPDSGDVTGILTVMDITEQIAAERVVHQLSVTGYDFVADVDLRRDTYKVLSRDDNAGCVPPQQGSHSLFVAQMAESRVVPRDRGAVSRQSES